MRRASRQGAILEDESNLVWRHYWSGGGNFEMSLPTGIGYTRERVSNGEIWEYLIEGRLDLDRAWSPPSPV
jgi:hypothetical protein